MVPPVLEDGLVSSAEVSVQVWGEAVKASPKRVIASSFSIWLEAACWRSAWMA
jgi:hypothetical protein